MSLLSPSTVQEKLAALKNWKLEGEEIVRHLEFPTFSAAIQFVNGVAELAEAANHHPDIDIRYNRVRLALVSHDAGGLTDRDFQLAAAINQLA
jgi:4a-hydroxytetrahydrobiopterin dehydratase